MTPEREKWWAELYRQYRGIKPPMPRDEVERRVRETLAAGKDGDFAVVKNLHVVIKNGRAAWFFKFTPKSVPAPSSAISICKSTTPKERPIKRKLGNYSEMRTCPSPRTITYDIAFAQTERLRDFIISMRRNMPEIDERKIFGLWSRGSQNDVSSLTLGEQKCLQMLRNIAGWLPAPATGRDEDGTDVDYYDHDDEVETSDDEETVALQPEELEGYDIVDENNINRSYFTEGEPNKS